MLVWWKDKLPWEEWSCPAIVTRVRKKIFGVVRFSDFEKFSLDMNALKKMRIISREKTKRYLKKEELYLRKSIREIKSELAEEKRNLKKFKNQTKKVFVNR